MTQGEGSAGPDIGKSDRAKIAQTAKSALPADEVASREKRVDDAIALLDRINNAVSKYDLALKDEAAAILMARAFGTPGHEVGEPIRRELAPSAQGIAPSEFSTLLESWHPETQPQWALLGAYFHTKMQGKETVTGQEINRTLRHFGTNIRNITDALGANMGTRPALILQTGKSGTARQARKTYKVTTAGVQFVERRLAGSEPKDGES